MILSMTGAMQRRLISVRPATKLYVAACAWTKKTVVDDPWFKLAKVIMAVIEAHESMTLPSPNSYRNHAVCILVHQSTQKEGYVSRAAYKLKEIQKKHKLIKPGGNTRLRGILESSIHL